MFNEPHILGTRYIYEIIRYVCDTFVPAVLLKMYLIYKYAVTFLAPPAVELF